jgi:hypothetical protein
LQSTGDHDKIVSDRENSVGNCGLTAKKGENVVAEHISFDELVAFVWMEKLTPELKQLTLRVNRHLMGCDQCAQMVEQLQQIHADGDELRRRQEAERILRRQADQVVPLFSHSFDQAGEGSVYAASQPRTVIIEERILTQEGTFSEKKEDLGNCTNEPG